MRRRTYDNQQEAWLACGEQAWLDCGTRLRATDRRAHHCSSVVDDCATLTFAKHVALCIDDFRAISLWNHLVPRILRIIGYVK